MNTDIKNDRLLRALTKLIYFYWEWFDLSLQDVRSGKRRKVTEVADAKFNGFAEAMAVMYGLRSATAVELDLRDWVRANEPPERNLTSRSFRDKRDAWIDNFVAHLYSEWNLEDES
jgi:hypothetical protein